MKKTIFLFGMCMGLLVLLLKAADYHFLVHHISLQIYLGLVALLFTSLGVWLGLKLTNRKLAIEPVPSVFNVNKTDVSASGLSQREFEVLQLISEGLSNQEIADRLFISLNTVKTHSSSLFAKLDVKRRTQAVQQAKALRLIS